MTSSQSLQKNPQRRTVRTLMVAATVCFALPVFAKSPIVLPCPDATEVRHKIPVSQLIATAVAHDMSIAALDDVVSRTVEDTIAPSEFLSPRAEDAIRAVFDEDPRNSRATPTVPLLAPIREADNASVNDIEEETAIDTHPSAERLMHTRLPGVSDDELSHYKKQMFRRDI